MWLKDLFKRKAVCEHSWVEDDRYTVNVYEHGHKKRRVADINTFDYCIKMSKMW